jgi:nephrocystin-4
VSVLNINVNPRPFAIHRVLRFFESENGIAKRLMKAYGYESLSSSFPEDSSVGSKFIHCLEVPSPHSREGAASNVVVEWHDSPSATVSEFLLRYRCTSFPNQLNFFILLYDDPYQSKLCEIWSIVVEARQRLELQGCVGNSSTVDLVIKGDRENLPRRVQAYSSASINPVIFKPEGLFQLVPGAYNRVSLTTVLRNVGLV